MACHSFEGAFFFLSSSVMCALKFTSLRVDEVQNMGEDVKIAICNIL
jgi:hypothetical protein